MLTRLAVAVLMSATSCVTAVAPAFAEGGPPPITVQGDFHNGVVETTVADDGSAGSQARQVADTSSGNGSSCKWSPDSTDDFVMLQSAGPGSLAGDLWQQGARYYNVSCSDGSLFLGVYVPPGSSAAGQPGQVTPGELAQQAWNRLVLPSPSPRHNPTGDAITGLATWWWVDDGSWQALSQRTAAGPVWAQVTASPVRSVWDAGDGSAPVVCAGPGTAYDPAESAEGQHSDCTYTYPRTSARQPQTGPDPNDRFFTVTVTTVWQVRWTGAGGATGMLPDISRTNTFPLRVSERETLVTGGAG